MQLPPSHLSTASHCTRPLLSLLNGRVQPLWFPLSFCLGPPVPCIGPLSSSPTNSCALPLCLCHSCVTFDQRGVGGSTGSKSLTGVPEVDDVVSVCQWVHEKHNRRILLVGSSAGTREDPRPDPAFAAWEWTRTASALPIAHVLFEDAIGYRVSFTGWRNLTT